MIVALFALAAAMVIGGSAAVIQGFPFVRLESGLAMVIAGSVTASAGAVLAGLGVVVVYLRRVERGLRSRPVPVPTALPPFPDLPRADAPAPRPVLPAALGGAAGLGGALAANGRRQAEPTFEDTLFEPAPPEAAAPEPAREPELPMPGLQPRPPEPVGDAGPPPESPAGDEPAAAEAPARPTASAAAPDDGDSPGDDLFARPDAAEAERPALRPSLDAAEARAEMPTAAPSEAPAEAAPEPPAPEPAVPEPRREPETREIVGKYASGGNTYVMFADGSIEAETPQGRFTFASLDELKAFVDAGGERSARGAA